MKQEICDVLKACYEKGWISTRDGNASYKRAYETDMLITPSGAVKYMLHPDNILIVPVEIKASSKASGEIKLHSKLQEHHKEQRAVLHVHPTHIVAAMYAGYSLQAISKEFPELYRYTKVGPTVPKLEPLTEALADKTCKRLGLDNSTGALKYDIVGQVNHGVTAVGKTLWEAFEHIERLEHICEIVLKSQVR